MNPICAPGVSFLLPVLLLPLSPLPLSTSGLDLTAGKVEEAEAASTERIPDGNI